MFCPHCGSSNLPTSVRCSACGTAFAGGPPADALTATLATAAQHPDMAVTMAPDDTTAGLGSARAPRGLPAAFARGGLIAGRYHIVRLLGAGGMGAVYQAWDEKLGVPVALKVILQTDQSGDPRKAEDLERRFKRELLLARQVTDKNVVRIHDLGEVDGTLYITMSYVEGKNLAVLAAEGRLSIERVLQIVKQVASGLAAAHEAGIVHRDLKPTNIMIDVDERALIMDFGIARSATPEFATRTSAVVGTLEYMAPEQAEGRELDHRCDQYGFGLILYDLLTGGRHAGPSAVADLMARMHNPLPSVRSIAPEVPDALAQIVDRCLQRDPAARYATTAELVQALNRLDAHGREVAVPAPRRMKGVLLAANAAAILIVAGLVAWMVRGRAGSAPPAPHEPVSVLIADFENRVNDPVFDGSIEQALTIGVEGAPFITTYQRSQARRLAAQLITDGKLDDKAAQLISVRDGVKFVLAGSIEGGAGGYQIVARLIDPAVGKTLKTATARAGNKAEVLQAVGSLAADIRRDLGDTTPESARLAASETFTTTSLEAVREYNVAQDLQNDSKYEDAIPHFKNAIDRDPQFGRAYSGWATCAFELGRNDEADQLWKKALSLMDRMTERERYRTLGTYYLAIARNFDQAIDNYVKLLERYPADRSAHNNLAIAYFNKLNFPKALEEGRKALDIYKGSLKFRNNYVLYAMYAGDFATAETGARQLLREDPKFSDAYFPLAMALLAKDDRAGARATFEQMAGIVDRRVTRSHGAGRPGDVRRPVRRGREDPVAGCRRRREERQHGRPRIQVHRARRSVSGHRRPAARIRGRAEGPERQAARVCRDAERESIRGRRPDGRRQNACGGALEESPVPDARVRPHCRGRDCASRRSGERCGRGVPRRGGIARRVARALRSRCGLRAGRAPCRSVVGVRNLHEAARGGDGRLSGRHSVVPLSGLASVLDGARPGGRRHDGALEGQLQGVSLDPIGVGPGSARRGCAAAAREELTRAASASSPVAARPFRR